VTQEVLNVKNQVRKKQERASSSVRDKEGYKPSASSYKPSGFCLQLAA